MLTITFTPPLVTIALNDPAKRNALGLAMFDAFDAALKEINRRSDVHILLLRGEGPTFCAGFDLAAAVSDPSLMAQFITRLSLVNRAIRRSPQIVVAAVQGAAIAGGCALLSACDFVVASRQAKLGYPVHRIGVSPAVTIPTLRQAIGDGAARALLMSGDLINAAEGHRIGLITHLAESDETVLGEATALCHSLAQKGPHALRVTKAWLNELDGSDDDNAFTCTAQASGEFTSSQEARERLQNWHKSRQG